MALVCMFPLWMKNPWLKKRLFYRVTMLFRSMEQETRFDGLTHEQAVKVTKNLISLQTMKALFGLMPYSVCHL